MHKVDGALYEPVEEVVCSVPNEYAGTVISKLNLRKGIMVDIQDEGSYTRILYTVPTGAAYSATVRIHQRYARRRHDGPPSGRL